MPSRRFFLMHGECGFEMWMRMMEEAKRRTLTLFFSFLTSFIHLLFSFITLQSLMSPVHYSIESFIHSFTFIFIYPPLSCSCPLFFLVLLLKQSAAFSLSFRHIHPNYSSNDNSTTTTTGTSFPNAKPRPSGSLHSPSRLRVPGQRGRRPEFE